MRLHTEFLSSHSPSWNVRDWPLVHYRTSRLVSQAFAFDHLQARFGAFAVRGLSVIVPVIELGKVQRQVLFADMVERADHATLQEREEPFNAIGVRRSSDIFLGRMIHRL